MRFPIDLSSLGNAFLFGTALFSAFLIALWISLVFWTYRDCRTRTQDRVLRILAALLPLLLGPLGVLVYLVLRPQRTLDQAYQTTLEEEALLSEIEARTACPGCGNRTAPDWQLCPSCNTRLRRPCSRCGKLMELPWKLCPYCATPAPGTRAEAAPENAKPTD
ncbi:MAG: zinc ribbon domain-containing protein [Chloroflexi bacterium]|nr:zinc ribbon domain-containing protein [Chloroflexota bacterium]